MTFDLFWIDFFIKERLFGFGIFSIKGEEIHRSFVAVYWNDGELLVDLFWFRIFSAFPFWRLYDDEKDKQS